MRNTGGSISRTVQTKTKSTLKSCSPVECLVFIMHHLGPDLTRADRKGHIVVMLSDAEKSSEMETHSERNQNKGRDSAAIYHPSRTCTPPGLLEMHVRLWLNPLPHWKQTLWAKTSHLVPLCSWPYKQGNKETENKFFLKLIKSLSSLKPCVSNPVPPSPVPVPGPGAPFFWIRRTEVGTHRNHARRESQAQHLIRNKMLGGPSSFWWVSPKRATTGCSGNRYPFYSNTLHHYVFISLLLFTLVNVRYF